MGPSTTPSRIASCSDSKRKASIASSALPTPAVPAYMELNGRFGWNLNDRLELSLSGRNLLHARHVEYLGGAAISRSVIAELQWRF